MPVHDWTQVDAGTFHAFHCAWITHLSEALNDGLLPDEFYALPEQHARSVIPDVLALTTRDKPHEAAPSGVLMLTKSPPKVALAVVPDEKSSYRLARRTLTIRHRSNHRIVALLEIVSPGNKDGKKSLQQFVDKAVTALQQRIHLLIVDLHPPGQADPVGIHGAIWDELAYEPYEPPAGKPLTLVAYLAEDFPTAYVEPLAVGSPLPEMPLFLSRDWYINAPLESTYQAAYRGLPAYWRGVIEGHS